MLGLCGGRHWQHDLSISDGGLASEHQIQLPELVGRELLRAAPKAVAIGEEHSPGEPVVAALHLHDERHHLIDSGEAVALGKHACELGFERLVALLSLYLDISVQLEGHTRCQ